MARQRMAHHSRRRRSRHTPDFSSHHNNLNLLRNHLLSDFLEAGKTSCICTRKLHGSTRFGRADVLLCYLYISLRCCDIDVPKCYKQSGENFENVDTLFAYVSCHWANIEEITVIDNTKDMMQLMQISRREESSYYLTRTILRIASQSQDRACMVPSLHEPPQRPNKFLHVNRTKFIVNRTHYEHDRK